MPKHTFSIARLAFTAPLHIGSVREDFVPSEEMIRSDTLYAAIMHVWDMLGYEVPKEPPFAISSLFPYKKVDNTIIHFLPVPLTKPAFDVEKGSSDKNPKFEKQRKKIQWADADAFGKITRGEKLAVGVFDEEAAAFKNLQGTYYSQETVGAIFRKQTTPRTKISRDGSEDTTIFYIERLHFEPDAGLYLIFQADTPESEKKLKNALEVLQDEGIGTDRTVGNGFFRVSYDTLSLDLPVSNGLYTNLSLFCPENSAQLSPMMEVPAQWELIKRGGWITASSMNTWRKQDTHMFREGSVFHLPPNQVNNNSPIQQVGYTRDVTPEIALPNKSHSIYRTGKALFIPILIP